MIPRARKARICFSTSSFFDQEYYELTEVGRIKINHRLNLKTPA